MAKETTASKKSSDKKTEAQRAAFAKLAEFTKKTAKSLDVSIASDLSTNRQGRNGALPSSSLCFDLITGGGFPKHRLTILSGLSGGGKTTVLQSGIANQLKNGGIAHYGDFEGACDGAWIKNSTGTDLSFYEGNVKKNIPQTFYPLLDFASGDDYFRYIKRMMEETVNLGLDEILSGDLTHLFALDSIPSLAPEGLVEDDETGSKPFIALMLSKWLPLVRSQLKRSNSALVMINQIRQKVRLKNPMENPDYEPGGNAPVFLADLRVRFEQVQPKHVTGDKHTLADPKFATPKAGGVWNEVNKADGTTDQYVYRKLHTMKNRVYPAFRQTYIRICISKAGGEGTGIDPVFDTLNFYEEIGMLKWDGKKDIVYNGQEYTYADLKQELSTKPDLREEALDLLDSGKAFDHYAGRLSGLGIQLGKPDVEVEEELDKTPEVEQ